MAFNRSDYKEKYTWTGRDLNGIATSLQILLRTTQPVQSKSIYGLSGISLNIQGSQEEITCPIVKTSLSFRLIDAPELSTDTVKAGGWQEFFTPDSTLYLVELWKAIEPGNDELFCVWRGYITPDSWEEDLDYRGEITIVARDNLGHLQDFEFDRISTRNDGLISIDGTISALLNDYIAFPMAFSFAQQAGDSKPVREVSPAPVYVHQAGFCASLFEGKNCYEVIEELLESIGYCMRFVDNCSWSIQPIRSLALHGHSYREDALADCRTLEFYNGTHRLDPAYKQIKDTLSYKRNQEHPLELKVNFNGSYTGYNGEFWNTGSQQRKTFTGKADYGYGVSAGKRAIWSNGYFYFDGRQAVPNEGLIREDGEDALKQALNLAADPVNTFDGCYVETMCDSLDIKITATFGRSFELKDTSTLDCARLKDYIRRLRLAITYTLGANTYYWNNDAGEWQRQEVSFLVDVATQKAETYTAEVTLADADFAGVGELRIYFLRVVHEGSDTPDYGAYARLYKLAVGLNSKTNLESDTVTTINGTTYNVMLERKPVVGPLSKAVPWFNTYSYENALWHLDRGLYPQVWQYQHAFWGLGEDAISLSGLIHKQILCFHYRPMSILEGDCWFVDKTQPWSAGSEYIYKNKRFLLQSGNIDVLECRINGAIFHEYIWYDELWDTD